MKIALTIPTGRSRVKEVVKAFVENAVLHGCNPKDFSIYLSIDTGFENTKLSDFKLDPRVENRVNKVVYISRQKRAQIGRWVAKKCNVDLEIVKNLFVGSGYSKQRNSALFLALKDGNDYAICLDDDEAPFIPIKKENGKICWKNLDFFTPHLKELSTGTDITRGPYMGYLSPIPSDFDRDVPEEIREKLGEALKWGSEIITKYSFFDLINKIKYLSEEKLIETEAIVIEEGETGKQVLTGNMGINLHSVREGKIPIFYNPPKARGEDAIFAMQLSDLVVKEVKSYIFHDPFKVYPEIFEGKFPEILKRIPLTSDSKQRFANALMGWLKYAPILINLTSNSEEKKQQKIKEMLNKIEEPTQELANLLDLPELKECKKILAKYNRNVEFHYNNLIIVQKEWKNKILPALIN
ncbi:MAG: hypothetical protein ACE5ES_01380 [Candidatus Nanoarchaeia archaeon]